MTEYDRAAPNGTGAVKAGGNYAADLLPLKKAKAEGFGTTLYLDCVEQKCERPPRRHAAPRASPPHAAASRGGAIGAQTSRSSPCPTLWASTATART